MSEESKEELEERVDQLEQTVSKMLPNRRAVLGGVAGLGALTLGTGTVSADASTSDGDGNVGLPSDRVDLFADGADVVTLNGGGPLSDGDGTERKHWVIANGASDPSGAAADDIIFEEA